MAGGRKKKPTALHELQGTARPDRTNPDEPEPSADLPVAPKSLTKEERAHFNTIVGRLEELGYASRSHTEVIVTLARRLTEADKLSRAINRHGMTYETRTQSGGRMVRMRPEVAARSEAQRHAQSLLSELGLSPTSSPKVRKPKGATAKKAGNAFMELLG